MTGGPVDLVAAQQAVRTLVCPLCQTGTIGHAGTCGITPRGDHAARWTSALFAQKITDDVYTAALSTVGEVGPVMAGTMIPEFTVSSAAAAAELTASGNCVRCGTGSHEVISGVQPGDQWVCTSESGCAIRAAWNAAGQRCAMCGHSGPQPTHHNLCDDGRPYRIAVLTPGQMETALLYLAAQCPATTDDALTLIDVLRLAIPVPAPEGGQA